MLNYKNYEVIDFLKDESFRRWTLHNNLSDHKFWELWLSIHPEKYQEVAEAQFILLTQNDLMGEINEIEIKQQIDKLLLSIKQINKKKKGKLVKFIQNPLAVSIAASFLLLAGFSYVMYTQKQESLAELIAFQTTEKVYPIVTYTNTSNEATLVLLPDGSSLVLKPNSTVKYPQQFADEKRELDLSGEAFFEIAKDKQRPFYIYTKDITTKVVGTSFTIKAFDKDKEVKVSVKSGIVTVYKTNKGDKTKSNTKKTNKENVLKENQQMVFDLASNEVKLSEKTKTQTADFIIEDQSFVFDNTPLSTVFETLENSYGMHIEADSESIKNCHLTATLGDEPFQVKLNLICEAVNANYVQNNDSIVVKSNGCE